MTVRTRSFSQALEFKIHTLKSRRQEVKLGRVTFHSPYLLAPLSGIGLAPWRLLMEDLGVGGTVSELISAHGLSYKNAKTHQMLYRDPREDRVGLQLFGDDPHLLAEAAKLCEEQGVMFVDINMGCPVRKVVCKGAGSALLKNPLLLGSFFHHIRQAINIPLSIKIRTGWKEKNAAEVIHIAREEGIEWVAIHGRTREEGYSGKADWNYMNDLAKEYAKEIPILGNGDLVSADMLRQVTANSPLSGVLIGRGLLKNPFLALEAYLSPEDPPEMHFVAKDYAEVFERFADYLSDWAFASSRGQDRQILVSLRKHLLWAVSHWPGVNEFRQRMFHDTHTWPEVLKLAQDHFMDLGDLPKVIPGDAHFMEAGHG